MEIEIRLSAYYRESNYHIPEIDSVAEWLRRETRNLMGFSRAGSNPAAVVNFFELILAYLVKILSIMFLNKK